MFCPNCSTLNEDCAHFCGACGTKLTGTQILQQPITEQPAAQSDSYYQVQSWSAQTSWQHPRTEKVPGSGLGVASLVLGIVSIVLSMVWWLSALCGGLAVLLATVALCKAERANQGNGVATAGLVCGLIGIALAVVIGLVWNDILLIPDDAGLDRWVDM